MKTEREDNWATRFVNDVKADPKKYGYGYLTEEQLESFGLFIPIPSCDELDHKWVATSDETFARTCEICGEIRSGIILRPR